MEARASAKYLRGSAQKARLVVDMIRGKNVNEALAVLRFANKRAANGIEKCVRSAVANATEKAEKANVAIDPDDLWVKACFVDMGPTKNRRRFRPAPQGRAYRERRHFCHVTVLLSNEERAAQENGKKTVVVRAGASKAGKPKTGGEAKRTTTKRASVKTEAKAEQPSRKRASKQAAAPKAPAEESAPVETAANETSEE
jgi:large subunit ribosomal protein L22